MPIEIAPLIKKDFYNSRDTYLKIFKEANYYVTSKKKHRGLHETIANHYVNKFKGKRVLDIGCGYGRFSILSSQVAKYVVGIDFTENAIKIANDLKNYFDLKNIAFKNVSLEKFESKEKFDFILISGTLEHIINYKKMINKINSLLKTGGTFISDSPSEFNPRGNAQAQLYKLFNMPVTLTDVRIITPSFMENLAFNHDFTLNKKVVGNLYYRAWGKVGYDDLLKRIPKVIKDFKKTKYNPQIKKKDFDNYFNWLCEQFEYGEELLKCWVDEKKLLKIKPFNPIRTFHIRNNFKSKFINFSDVKTYMDNNFSYDRYYSIDKNVSKLGGNIIYELTKN